MHETGRVAQTRPVFLFDEVPFCRRAGLRAKISLAVHRQRNSITQWNRGPNL